MKGRSHAHAAKWSSTGQALRVRAEDEKGVAA